MTQLGQAIIDHLHFCLLMAVDEANGRLADYRWVMSREWWADTVSATDRYGRPLIVNVQSRRNGVWLLPEQQLMGYPVAIPPEGGSVPHLERISAWR